MPETDRLPLVVIACQVLQDMLERMLPPDVAAQVTFMDYGLHRVPSKMTWTLQDALDGIEEPSLVLLGYGLCGNGLNGIQAGKHTLLVPSVDDCIAMLLGSRQAYLREFEDSPGTYYLSKGWLESGSHPLKEYNEYVVKYGTEDANWIMDQQYQHYRRIALVAHSEGDLEKYRPAAQEVAAYCARWNMRYEEILGSDGYVRRLVDLAVALAAGTVPVNTDEDFLLISPGGAISQEQFRR